MFSDLKHMHVRLGSHTHIQTYFVGYPNTYTNMLVGRQNTYPNVFLVPKYTYELLLVPNTYLNIPQGYQLMESLRVSCSVQMPDVGF